MGIFGLSPSELTVVVEVVESKLRELVAVFVHTQPALPLQL